MKTENLMKQQALALKYRPMDFDELVGQEAVSRTLSLALDSGRLSHAYLFSGLRGSGKTSSARIFARALQCEEGPRSKPCGICANCIAANPHKMSHLDIMELDGASNRKIDDIRDLIEQTKYHPNMGRFKIFIIDEVHMLTREAHNALLKTLEEPPEYVKFILATTDPLKLPATILSRTQHFRFKQISNKSILGHLKNILEKEGISYQEDALQLIVRSGAGSLRDTLTLLDQAIIYSNYNITTEVCVSMLGLINAQSFEALFDGIFKQDRQELLKILEGFFEYESGMLVDEMSIFLKDKLLKGQDSRYSPLIIDRFFRILTQAKELLFLGAENEFILTLTAFKMLEALKVETIEQAIKHLEKGFFEEQKVLQNHQTTPSNSPQTPPQQPQNNTQDTSQSQATKTEVTQPHLEYFALLQQKIYDLDFDLGEIFSKEVRFISYIDNKLTWETHASGKNRERLIHSYTQIKNCVFEVFGFETQIQSISNPKNQETEQTKQNLSPQNLPQKQTTAQPQPLTQEPKTPESQRQNTPKDSAKEEVEEILASPFFQAMKESLEIQKVNVRPIKNPQADI